MGVQRITGEELADVFMTEFLKGQEEGFKKPESCHQRRAMPDKECPCQTNDYAIGRWVAFPNARMSGKVRQIVDHAPSDCGFMAYWLTSPELEPSNRFKTVGMKLNGHKSFGTKEEAEKYLQEAEGEFRKKILQIVTKDSLTGDGIFDPERFDQNSFEWGAIYRINQIRDTVEEFEDGYVISDEQFIEMLRPLKKVANVYAEAHGKNKAWVKNTVLSVPKAFANAFDTLSDGEGVSKEHFLKVLTVEGVCALAEGDIDSVHELENYYYRKGIYAPKGGYAVGNFVVIIEDPPSKNRESERIRHIIAIRGDEGGDDPTLVFWNIRKNGTVERKSSQCSKPFHKYDDAYDWWFVENGDGAREVNASGGERLQDYVADKIEAAFGIVQDAGLDPSDPDFWMKHDRARHGGHFDPKTQTCKLREQYEQGEKIENLKDEMDDMEGEEPDVGASGAAGRGTVTPEEDAAYLEAVNRGDMETAEQMVRDAAKASGFTTHVYHGTELEYFNNGKPFTIFDAASHFGTKEIAEQVAKSKSSETKGNAPYVYSVFLKLDNPKRVSDTPKSWNDTHSEYWWNQMHMAAEEGYDGLVYSNKYEDKDEHDDSYVPLNPAQIKSADPVTYDDNGNVIPLSRRFDDGSDIRGDVNWRERGDLNSASENDIISTQNQKGEQDVQVQGNDVPQRADRNEMGGEQPESLRPHSILEAASAIGRGVERRVQESTRVRDKETESAARITEYAKENGIWRDDVEKDFDSQYGTEDTQKNTEGAESIVWFDRDRGIAIKAMGLDFYGSPTLALERIELHNKYFPHAPLNVVGFSEVKDTYEADGGIAQYGRKFNIIAEQPLIDTTTELSKDDIRKRLESMGFKVVSDNGDSGWNMETPDGLAKVADLHERNVFGTRNGGVAVIDCDIRKKTKEDFAKDLSKKHPNLDADKILAHLSKFDSAEDEAREFRKILSSGQIAEDSGEEVGGGTADFWQKHDKQHHHGHYDPETQTCSLRDEAKSAEEKHRREDEADDIAVSDIKEKYTPEPHKEKHGGISRILTGSGADYSKPSLLKVGTGEGSQVYGWGLYGSNVRGVAESYARQGKKSFPTEVFHNGVKINDDSSRVELGISSAIKYVDEHPEEVDSVEEYFSQKIAALESHGRDWEKPFIEEEKKELAIYKNDPHAWEVKKPREIVYEQTFFTDRAPGDETHLLKWYEPVPSEQLEWIGERAEKEGFELDASLADVIERVKEGATGRDTPYVTGSDVYKSLEIYNSPMSASAFLARTGIDGIKYPVDSYGGKAVKNGDDAGWNYVSFRDDNIRIDRKYVDGQKVFDYQELMARKFPGVDAIAVLQRISKMGSPEEMAAEFRRILRSKKA